MTKDMMIGVDLAKTVFQLHAASMTGQPKFRKKLSRQSFPKFMAEQPPAVVVMEACGSAHFWANKLQRLGHTVKLMAPQFVKPYVKSNKNDVAGRARHCPSRRPRRSCSLAALAAELVASSQTQN